jgi:hypothetical protein
LMFSSLLHLLPLSPIPSHRCVGLYMLFLGSLIHRVFYPIFLQVCLCCVQYIPPLTKTCLWNGVWDCDCTAPSGRKVKR